MTSLGQPLSLKIKSLTSGWASAAGKTFFLFFDKNVHARPD